MKALSRWLAPLEAGRGVLLWGEHLRPLAAAAAAWGLTRGTGVLVVDAANRFDPYLLVREARRRGLAPADALLRVRVARAFTCHQLVRLLKEGLPSPLTAGNLMLLLGPVSLFYDEQVPLRERRRLFHDLVRLLAAIKIQNPLLLMQPLLPRDAANRHFGYLLTPVVDYFVEYGGRARDFFVSGPSPPPIPPTQPAYESRGRRGRWPPRLPGPIKPHKGLGKGF